MVWLVLASDDKQKEKKREPWDGNSIYARSFAYKSVGTLRKHDDDDVVGLSHVMGSVLAMYFPYLGFAWNLVVFVCPIAGSLVFTRRYGRKADFRLLY